MTQDIMLLLCNTPDADCARRLAHALVTQRLAACVNLLPEVESVYHWQGQLESAREIPLLCKTTRAALPARIGALAPPRP